MAIEQTGDDLCTNCHEREVFIVPHRPGVDGEALCRVCLGILHPRAAGNIAVELLEFESLGGQGDDQDDLHDDES